MTAAQAKKRWALLGIGACAACCAIPLAGILGLGISTGSAIAAWQWLKGDWICLVLIVAAAVGAGWLYWRRRRKARLNVNALGQNPSTCQASCAADHSCCGEESTPSTIPGCNLNQNQLDERLIRFQNLFKDNFIKSWRDKSVVGWAFQSRPGVLQESEELARLESACCSELTFNVAHENHRVVWRISAPSAINKTLDLFESLPKKLRERSDTYNR